MTHDITVEHDALRCWTILSDKSAEAATKSRVVVLADELTHRMPDPDAFKQFIVEAAEAGGLDHAGVMVICAERAVEDVNDEATAIADKAAWAVGVEVRNAYATPHRIMARYREIIDLATKESSG